jgi:hypothetical protein
MNMTVRSKVWLLVAIGVAVIAGATGWLHTYALRRELIRQTKDNAQAVMNEIADALVALDADAEDHDLTYVISTYSLRYPRIQLIELHVEREDLAPRSASWRPTARSPRSAAWARPIGCRSTG